MGFRPDWFGHAIGRNHACQRPSHFVFVSVETRQTEVKTKQPHTRHELKSGAACHVAWKKKRGQKETWFQFTENKQWWDWLKQWQRAKSVVWVVAFDALFDFTILGLWSEIEVKHYAVDRPARDYHDPVKNTQVVSSPWRGLLAIDGRPFHIETQGEAGRVNFTDLGNYYPCRFTEIEGMVSSGQVEDITVNKQVGLEQGLVSARVKTIKSAYLGLVKQWESDDNGNWKLSAAGLAWSNYRHRHGGGETIVHHHAAARDLEWQSYVGGEVRCYYRGNPGVAIAHYDVNSLYPYVMATYDYPTELIDHIVCPNLPIVQSISERYGIIIDCTLETDIDAYPARNNHRTVYPVGRFRCVLCGPEAIGALRSNSVVSVHAIAYYRMAKLFESYCQEWYERKRRAQEIGDVATTAFCKMMLNSLQGKFAQRTPVWETDSKIDVIRPWTTFPYRNPDTHQISPARSVGWLGQRVVQRRDKKHAFPAISAYICAYARSYMRGFRSHIPPSVVFYQDTDSLMLDASHDVTSGSNPLPISNDMGGFRQIGVYKSVIFRGPKNYETDSKRVVAGIKESDLRIGESHYVGSRIERTSAVVSREPDCTIREKTQHFDTPGTCNEGGYGDDGWSYPLILS